MTDKKAQENEMEYQVKTDIFTLRQDEWQIQIGDVVLPAIWNSKGAARAGLRTECKRRKVHELSRDCWCGPTVEEIK